MYDILSGMRIIELSAFVAAPLAGLSLAQLGADVIRVDPPGGGIDYKRWPLTEDGHSIYWAGLNKGKRSVALDLKQEDGCETFRKLLEASGEDGGIVLTNLTGPKWLEYEELRKVRPDLILVSLTGHHDGTAAVDYTVNCAVGIPFATGNATPDNPVNSVLPAWDLLAGMTLATGLLAAERHRRKTGKGQHVKLALSDIAYSTVSNLGYMGEAEVLGKNRPAIGNHLYGAFGHNLPTNDGRQVMVTILTKRHWTALLEATDTIDAMAEIADRTGQDLTDDSGRYHVREEILAVLTSWSKSRNYSDIADVFDKARILWGPYQTFCEMVENDPRASIENPMFEKIDQPGIGNMLIAGSPLTFSSMKRKSVKAASNVGADKQSVLQDLLDDDNG